MTTYALSEGHKFRGPSSDFLYLVPSGGIFALDALSSAILEALNVGPLSREQLIGRVSQRAVRPLSKLPSALKNCARCEPFATPRRISPTSRRRCPNTFRCKRSS